MASTLSGRRNMAGSAAGQPPLTTDSVTDQLRALILDGTLGIGVQLKQEALATRFGVSRIPVREALKRLDAEGLIPQATTQGPVVASRSHAALLTKPATRTRLDG